MDAVLQIPTENWRDLPFVITTQSTTEQSIRDAVDAMGDEDFLRERPLALPMENSL